MVFLHSIFCCTLFSFGIKSWFSPPVAALPTGYSLVSSAALAVLTLAVMQLFRDQLGVEGRMAVLGGFIGSWFFVFILTVRGQCVCVCV